MDYKYVLSGSNAGPKLEPDRKLTALGKERFQSLFLDSSAGGAIHGMCVGLVGYEQLESADGSVFPLLTREKHFSSQNTCSMQWRSLRYRVTELTIVKACNAVHFMVVHV